MRSWRHAWLWMATAAVSWGAPALAPAPVVAQENEEPQALVIEAANLMAGDARHQALADQGGDPSAYYPGDVIRYRLVFTNITDVAVRSIEFNDPLPPSLQYVGGSALADRDDVIISYSIDGGQVYSAQPMIEDVIDGERVTRPAPPEMYTHIRWMLPGWVQPGAQVTAEFRAQLAEPAGLPQQPSEAR